MSLLQVQELLGSAGDEGQGDGRFFPVSWQGTGRNVVHFAYQGRGDTVEHVVDSKQFFCPSLWDRFMECWSGVELRSIGGKTKRPNGPV